jgi:hypothetical protein
LDAEAHFLHKISAHYPAVFKAQIVCFVLIAAGENERFDAGIPEKIPNQGTAGPAIAVNERVNYLKIKVKVRYMPNVPAQIPS